MLFQLLKIFNFPLKIEEENHIDKINMPSNTRVVIIVTCILVFIGIIAIVLVVIFSKKKEAILPPPELIDGISSLLQSHPSYLDYVYRYHFDVNLTNSQILKSLTWDDDFCKDYPELLDIEYRDLKTKNLKDILETAQKTFKSMNPDTPRANYVVPMAPKMVQQLLGHDQYEKLIHLIAPPEKWSTCYLWLNTKGYTTPMHGDTSHVVAFHLTGRKRWTLADRKNLSNCYPRPNRRGHLYCHAGNPYDKSLVEIYPKFSKIRYRHVDLLPGDLLVIPPKTLHFVHTFEPSFMVSIVLKNLNG